MTRVLAQRPRGFATSLRRAVVYRAHSVGACQGQHVTGVVITVTAERLTRAQRPIE
jgi:hypothetical protein